MMLPLLTWAMNFSAGLILGRAMFLGPKKYTLAPSEVVCLKRVYILVSTNTCYVVNMFFDFYILMQHHWYLTFTDGCFHSSVTWELQQHKE